MGQVFARKALLQNGWASNVRLRLRDGRIADVVADTQPEPGEFAAGVLIAGLGNAHSHAFQRALAGRTEERSPAGHDNFWSWRARMYELAGRIDAEALHALACQAYTEMLESGYTSVAEFHYLHREPGARSADGAMFEALCRAADDSGIRLCYVPVLYERAGFADPAPADQQAMFAMAVDEFLEHHAEACGLAGDRLTVGIGAHSLRAVSSDGLRSVVAAARTSGSPMHIHVAEQQREVDECVAAYGRRPVEWLLDNFDIDDSWCLVHATHTQANELESVARSGAVVCLCPSTEANLGDGLFALHDFLSRGGRIAIGSDSHTSINPFEELRWLEYGQRLASRSRNIASLQQPHVGRELYTRALVGGAQACGQGMNGLQAGAAADLVALYDDDAMLLGHGEDSLLDALVFSGYRLPIERVMVRGEWQVVDGDHRNRAASRRAYAAALERIGIRG